MMSQTQMSIADCGGEISGAAEGAFPLAANQLEGCIADIRISR